MVWMWGPQRLLALVRVGVRLQFGVCVCVKFGGAVRWVVYVLRSVCAKAVSCCGLRRSCVAFSLFLSPSDTLSLALSLSLIHSHTHRAGRRGSFGDAGSVGTGCSGGTDRAGDSGEEEEEEAAATPRMIDSPQPLMVIGLSRRTNRLYANGVLLAPSCGSFILHPGHGYLLFTALGAQPYVGGPTAWDVATLV